MLPPNESSVLRRAGKAPRAVVTATVVMLVVLGLDLLSKALSFRFVTGTPVSPGSVPDHEAVSIIPYVLSLKLVENRGAVFGIGQGQRLAFVLVGVVAVIVIVIAFLRSAAHRRSLHVALAMILAGALGNLYDRVMFGMVRDMFWLFPGVKLPFRWTWPGGSADLYPWVFNIADVALLAGLAILMLGMYREDRENTKKKARPGGSSTLGTGH